MRESFALSVWHQIEESIDRYPDRPALKLGKTVVNYRQLGVRAAKLASTILDAEPNAQPFAVVLGNKSITHYIGILAVLASGKGYLPINPELPVERALEMITMSRANVLIVDSESTGFLQQLIPHFRDEVTIILPDKEEWETAIDSRYISRLITASQINDNDNNRHFVLGSEQYAYLLFTSGTTGIPKGVPVKHENLTQYIRFITRQYDLNEMDRFSQISETTFDLSAHDMFACWTNGACLIPSRGTTMMNLVSFLNEESITAWLSVPSVITLLTRLNLLNANSLPLLRISLFCGEALSAKLADVWQSAAPNSLVENLYGPTEATIAISRYRWNNKSNAESNHGMLPIGRIFEGHKALIDLDDGGASNILSGRGELLVSGPQVTEGYLRDSEATQASFVEIDGVRWYKTGDIVSKDDSDLLLFHGRRDTQIKVRGYRIELQEVETVIRNVAGTELAYVVPWPIVNGNAQSLVGVISGGLSLEESDVLLQCRKRLPVYMIPRRIIFIEDIPLNQNGKVDRRAINSMVSELLGDYSTCS